MIGTDPHDHSPTAIAAADVEEPSSAIAGQRPKPPLRLLGWARENLFGSVPNTILTLLALALLWEVVPPLLSWALVNAHLGGSAEQCREQGGACWTLVTERHRLMLFGVYPYDQHWRPLLATFILIALLATSSVRALWRRWLLWAWAGGFAVIAGLMWGGFLGLPYVETALWGGLPLTLALAVLGIALAFPFSIVLALGRRSDLPAIRALSVGYIELVRGLPLVSVLFMASVMFPLFLPEGVTTQGHRVRAQVRRRALRRRL